MGIKRKIATGSIALASATLLAFVHHWEGQKSVVYPDTLAGNLPTVCAGITKYSSPYPVVLGDYWSDAKCKEVEGKVIKGEQMRLASCITNDKITQSVFDALSDHAHHFGSPSTCASRALGLINEGKIKQGCEALAHAPSGRPVWSYVRQPDGSYKFVQGLYNRQLAEVKLCLSGLH